MFRPAPWSGCDKINLGGVRKIIIPLRDRTILESFHLCSIREHESSLPLAGDTNPMSKRTVTAIVLCCGVVGCQRNIERSDVTGEYVSQYSVSDTLELSPDGTYVHRFADPAGPIGKEIVERNTWEFQASGGTKAITFNGFLPSWPQLIPKRRGFWVVEPERKVLRRSIRLCIDPDLGRYYVQRLSGRQEPDTSGEITSRASR
jgi:hypothetical protein